MATPSGSVVRLDKRVAQLTHSLAEATEQQAATSQVLEIIGRPSSELEPVFETVLRLAVRLCRADAGVIHQLEDGTYQLACVIGGSPAYREYVEQYPIKEGPGTLVGRVGIERRAVQIPDVLADPAYEWHTGRDLGGFRTIFGVPMLTGERVLGVITLWRHRVEPFGERTVQLMTTLAAQGAIAIQNRKLFRELELRGRDLSRSVDELSALGEISQAVSSSLDLHEVLTTIVTRAVQLSGTAGGSIFEFDRATELFELSACYGTDENLQTALRAARIPLNETFMGRAAINREPMPAPDLEREPSDPHIDVLRRAGWRSMLAVPLLRETEIIGALIVRRHVRGAFPDRTAEVLETLASQSVVAIHNARVFRELEEKRQQLEIASQHKSEFLASMSHELRTPLNAVIGFSDVLLERMFGDVNERQEEYLLDIRNSGRHLLELINEILDLSKVEAGQMELEPSLVSLREVLEHGLAMVRERAARAGIRLRLDPGPDACVVWADELKLKQVVLNLLTNAVKFTGDGGEVTVTASVHAGEAQVLVRDSGMGIAETEQERIFEAFQRGGRESRSGMEGTGLGLTLSKRIVELHGGRIWLTSRLGAGSTFGFAIPISSGPVPEPDTEPAHRARLPTTAEAGARTILVIEDDAHSADLLSVYLEGAGFGVAVAPNGSEGLELARSLEPAGVILDILLPGLDGWNVLARLKADPQTARLPVVVVTMLDERGKGFALGAAEYLVKPVGREQVLDALARCVSPEPDRRMVVVIGDDPEVDTVEAVLAPEGYSVVKAPGGDKGIALVRRERPAVVLVDLLMPGLDGFSLVEHLSSDAATEDIPIVVVTSEEMTSADRERLAGQISYLARKSAFGGTQLVELVDRLAAARSAPEEVP